MSARDSRRYVVVDLNVAEDEALLASTVKQARLGLQRLLIPDIVVNEQVKSKEKWVETLFKFTRYMKNYAGDLCVAGDSQEAFKNESITGVPTRDYVSGAYTRSIRELLVKHSGSESAVRQFIGEIPEAVFDKHAQQRDLEHHRSLMEEGRLIVRRTVVRDSLGEVKRGDHGELVDAVGYRAMQLSLSIHPAFRRGNTPAFRCFVESALSVRCITAYATWLIWSAAKGHNSTASGAKERNSFYDCYYIGYGTLTSGLISKDRDQQAIASIVSQGFSRLRGRSDRWWETEHEMAIQAVESQAPINSD